MHRLNDLTKHILSGYTSMNEAKSTVVLIFYTHVMSVEDRGTTITVLDEDKR